MKKRICIAVLVLCMAFCMLCTAAFAEGGSGSVAKVGDTEYATIDEAIAAWTNNTTLTLLADVTLSDVIKLSSTEYHILDLGTFTMTAAAKKDAIQIVNNGRSKASFTLDIIADASNPGGITASGKAIVRTSGKSGIQDRPIIQFYNGVFNASYIVYHSGSNGTNCPQFQFHGGEFNGTIYTNRALNLFHGGTFNGSLMMSVDSSAYTRISGGTFKQLSNLYMSALNSNKFTIGSAKGVYDKGVYVDDNGYIVVGGPVVTEAGDKFEASSTNYSSAGNYLEYSSAKDNGLYYTSVEEAFADNNKVSGEVTVYVDELDMTGISYKGKIIPANKPLVITYDKETEPVWTVEAEYNGTKLTKEGNIVKVYGAKNPFYVSFESNGGTDVDAQKIASGYCVSEPPVPTKTGYTFAGWYTSEEGGKNLEGAYNFSLPVDSHITLYAGWTINQYTITFDTKGGSKIEPITQDYGTAVTAPEDPTLEGHTFAGWNKEIPATIPAENITITAEWTVNQYTIEFDTDGGSEIAPIAQDYGTAIIAPAAPTKQYYTFDGWDKEIPATMPAEDIELKAQWVLTEYDIGFTIVPEGAQLTVSDAEGNEIEAKEDGTYSLTHGDYSYKVVKFGYYSEEKNFTVTGDKVFNISLTKMQILPAEPEEEDPEPTPEPSPEPSPEPEVENPFIDVDEPDYFYEPVLWAVENEVTNGVTENTFVPDGVCTRDQVVTFLWRAAGCPTPESSEMPFTDVVEGAYYYDAVAWAIEKGITNGLSDTEFGVNVECTRAQIVTFLWRAMGCPDAKSGDMPFSDVAADAYYAEAVLWALENGITEGVGGGAFAPNAGCTRGQVVTFLWRCMAE